jgi:hypothetical protein
MSVKIKHRENSNADHFFSGFLMGAGLGVIAAGILASHQEDWDKSICVKPLNSPEYNPNVDSINIRHDWQMVGNDIRHSMDNLRLAEDWT